MEKNFCVILSVLILSSFIACAEEKKPQFSITVFTDKSSYTPGDLMRVSVNITNIGEEEVLAKEIHTKIIAKSWFGLTAHEESRSFSRNFRVNQTRFGYVEAPIPRYTPLGKYEIQVWVVYGAPESERQVVKEGDIKSLVGSREIDVDLGVVFLLLVLGILGILAYIASSISARKKPHYIPLKKPTKWTQPKLTDVRIEYAIILSLIMCIALSFIYVGQTKREKETFSVLYIKPGSYSNYVRDNTFSFVYGVECYEKYPTEYQLLFYLGDKLIGKKSFELCKLGPKSIRKIEEKQILHIPSDTEYPIKLRVVLKSWDNEYENAIWLRKPEETST